MNAPFRRLASDEARIKEQELKRRLQGTRLVLEVGLDDDLRCELRGLVERLAERRLHSKEIGDRFPALLATYLVAEGLFSYEDGDFWSAVTPAIRDGNGSVPGRAFEQALGTLGLEPFEHIFRPGVSYSRVNKILAHGGIPVRCLPDFFRLLHEELGRGVIEASEMLAEWRQSSWRLNVVTQPVQRFLQHGGQLALDFLDRCLDLVVEGAGGAGAPTPEEVGLPAYVVKAFLAMPTMPRDRHSRQVVRAPRPTVLLDPWSHQGPVMELPPIPVAADYPTWEVDDGERVHRVEGSSLVPERVALAPARLWACDYGTADGSSRRFVFEGLTEKPLLFFDADDGHLLRDSRALRAGLVWMISGPGVDATGVAQGISCGLPVTQEFPSLGGRWRGYRAMELDLTSVETVQVISGSDPVEIPVSSRRRPELVGVPLEGVTTETGEPVYASPPAIRVPHISGRSWAGRVKVGDRLETLLPEHFETDELDLGPLIGDGVASVHITLRGALGSDASFAFCIVPALEIQRPSRLVTAADGDIDIPVSAAPGVVVEPPLPTVGAENAQTTIEVHDSAGGSATLVVRIPRVQWGLAPAPSRPARIGCSIVHPDPSELQDGSPTLLDVRTGLPGASVRLRLQGLHARALAETNWMTSRTGRWAFDLDAFGDTVSQSGEPFAVIVLDADAISVPVARIQREYTVWGLRVKDSLWLADVREGTVEVVFNENAPLNGRVLRLWPRWRPWESAISGPLTDGVTGVASLDSPRLTPGEYLVEVDIGNDEWVAPQRPSHPGPGVVVARVGDEHAVSAYLDGLEAVNVPLSALEAARADGRMLPGLRRVAEAGVSRNAVLAAADAISVLPRGAQADPRLATLMDTLLLDTRASLTAFAGITIEGGVRRAELARLGLRMLGPLLADHPRPLDDGDMRALWSRAPLLAVVPDIVAACGGDELAALRCDRALGWNPLAGSKLPDGGAMDLQFASMPPDRISEFIDFLRAFPQGLLELGYYGSSILELLLTQLATDDANAARSPDSWFREHRDLIEAPLGVVECGLSRRIRWAVANSRAPKVGLPEWAAIPQVTLSAAGHLVASSERMDEALSALDRALSFCPGLVIADVIRAVIFDVWPAPEG